MNKFDYQETLSLAISIYKTSYKITFALAFMLSFVSEYFYVYMMKHGFMQYVESNGKTIPENFPSSGNILSMALVIILGNLLVNALIILIQGIMIKNDIKASDSIKIALQMFSKRVMSFTGAFMLSVIIMSVLSMFIQYIGMYITVMLFLTVMPAVLIDKKSVFEAVIDNFHIIRTNFFYMFRVSLTIITLMILKPILSLLITYILTTLGVEVNPLENSIQNIILVAADSVIIPFLFALSVATFYYTKDHSRDTE